MAAGAALLSAKAANAAATAVDLLDDRLAREKASLTYPLSCLWIDAINKHTIQQSGPSVCVPS